MNVRGSWRYESSKGPHPASRNIEGSIMLRAKLILIPAICAVVFTLGTPAMALNPQPLPPGFKQPTTFHASRFQAFCVSGQHYSKYSSGRMAH
jgi:heme/copper-type cytochrome/quinol oxidase subunit 2